MATQLAFERTRAWDCSECGTLNVTSERDLFAEQCHHCTCYTDVDWSETGDIELETAVEAADSVAAE